MRQHLSGYARFAWGVLAYNLLVILWGAFVRATGSGAGCGSHWPLCNGEVVPRAPEVATLIEFGHRLSSGVALLLVAGLVAGAWRGFRRGHPVRLGAALSGLFIVIEALVGAGLVLLELVADNASVARGVWAAGHLVNTFLLVGALALTAWWASEQPAPRLGGRGALGAALAAGLAGVLVLGVSGAVTALGDTLFPAATLAEARAQTFSDTAHLFLRLRIWHPAIAVGVGLCVLVGTLRIAAQGRPTLRHLATGLAAVYTLQLLVGLVNVWTLAPIGVQLVHLFLSDAVWILLVLLAATALAAEGAPLDRLPRTA